MNGEAETVDVVRSYIAAVERFDAAAACLFLDPEVVQVERPNRLYAKGQTRGLEQLAADLPKGRRVLRAQRYEIESIIAAGERVAVEARWSGVLDVPLGARAPGDELVAHIAMIFTVRVGRIVRQVNYDCYEDFSAAA